MAKQQLKLFICGLGVLNLISLNSTLHASITQQNDTTEETSTQNTEKKEIFNVDTKVGVSNLLNNIATRLNGKDQVACGRLAVLVSSGEKISGMAVIAASAGCGSVDNFLGEFEKLKNDKRLSGNISQIETLFRNVDNTKSKVVAAYKIAEFLNTLS